MAPVEENADVARKRLILYLALNPTLLNPAPRTDIICEHVIQGREENFCGSPYISKKGLKEKSGDKYYYPSFEERYPMCYETISGPIIGKERCTHKPYYKPWTKYCEFIIPSHKYFIIKECLDVLKSIDLDGTLKDDSNKFFDKLPAAVSASLNQSLIYLLERSERSHYLEKALLIVLTMWRHKYDIDVQPDKNMKTTNFLSLIERA